MFAMMQNNCHAPKENAPATNTSCCSAFVKLAAVLAGWQTRGEMGECHEHFAWEGSGKRREVLPVKRTESTLELLSYLKIMSSE